MITGAKPPVWNGLYDWWAADDYDGAGNWRSRMSSRVLAEATNYPSKQNNIINGRPVVRFDGVNDQLVVASSQALYKFFHDGTGCSFFIVLKRSSDALMCPVATNNSSSVADVGFSLVVDGRNIPPQRNDVYWQIGPSKITTATAVIDLESGFHIVVHTLQDGRSPADLSGYDGVTSLVTANASSYSTANAAQSLTVGHGFAPGAAQWFNGDIAEMLVYEDPLLSAEQAATVHYLANKYNLTV